MKMNAQWHRHVLWNQLTLISNTHFHNRIGSVGALGRKCHIKNKVTFFCLLFQVWHNFAFQKTGLLISLIYLYNSVSRPCLWFLIQNSTLLLNLWLLCLHLLFDQILFLHQSYKIFSKGRINISLVCLTTFNISGQESIFLIGTV